MERSFTLDSVRALNGRRAPIWRAYRAKLWMEIALYYRGGACPLHYLSICLSLVARILNEED